MCFFAFSQSRLKPFFWEVSPSCQDLADCPLYDSLKMAAPRSTEIKFEGTLAFADASAARELVDVVNEMLDSSMEVFWKAKTDETFAPKLSGCVFVFALRLNVMA